MLPFSRRTLVVSVTSNHYEGFCHPPYFHGLHACVCCRCETGPVCHRPVDGAVCRCLHIVMGDSLETSFWVMVLVQTIGSVDMPGSGARKMPSPRSYIAIVVTWTVLFVAAGIGQQARRGATAFAWLLVLAGFTIGPFGKRLIALFSAISGMNATAPVASPSGVSAVGSTANSASTEAAGAVQQAATGARTRGRTVQNAAASTGTTALGALPKL